MAVGRDICDKIQSIKGTQKITSAMELVAASKMRRAQERSAAGKPYSNNIRNIVEHIAQANVEYRHPYLSEREVKNVGIIVISSDRGLCGGLNINLFKQVVLNMQRWQQEKVSSSLVVIGSKGKAFFSRMQARILGSSNNLGDKPSLEQLIGVVGVMINAFMEKEVDEIYLASNSFVNTMTQKPVLIKLLPMVSPQKEQTNLPWDYLYEGDVKALLENLLQRYIESLVYQAVSENIACEQAARMVAMKSATDNAGALIDDLQLVYNKARQAAITQELSEIVSGADAL